jgi:hypothetical protein
MTGPWALALPALPSRWPCVTVFRFNKFPTTWNIAENLLHIFQHRDEIYRLG